MTRDSKRTYGIEKDAIVENPVFVLNVKDAVGADDAFFAVPGIFAAAGASAEMGTFLENMDSGVLGANIMGNKDAVEKVDVLKYSNTLMNI